MHEDRNRALGIDGAGVYQIDEPVEGGEPRPWVFCQLTQAQKGELVAWMKHQVRKEAAAFKDVMDKEDYLEHLAAIGQQIASGCYEWGTPGWFEMLNGLDGVKRLLWLALKSKQPKVEMADVERLMQVVDEKEVLHAIKEVLEIPIPFGQILERMAKANPDGTSPGEETGSS